MISPTTSTPCSPSWTVADVVDAVLAVDGLSYRYPGADAPAVTAVTFGVGAGEILGFLGPSGAGKTTTVHALTGLLRGWSGAVSLLGRPLGEWGRQLYDHIGVSWELPTGYPALTAREDLTHFAALHDRPSRDPDDLLGVVGLAEAADVRLGSYSKGMRTRLNVARAIAHSPALLFLDEPTTGLDPVTARQIRHVISSERQRGAGVFLTTHDMTTAEALCDRVAFVSGGSIVASGTPRALRMAAANGLVEVDYAAGEDVVTETVPLDPPDRLLELVGGGTVRRLTSVEPDLAEVFARVTRR